MLLLLLLLLLLLRLTHLRLLLHHRARKTSSHMRKIRSHVGDGGGRATSRKARAATLPAVTGCEFSNGYPCTPLVVAVYQSPQCISSLSLRCARAWIEDAARSRGSRDGGRVCAGNEQLALGDNDDDDDDDVEAQKGALSEAASGTANGDFSIEVTGGGGSRRKRTVGRVGGSEQAKAGCKAV